ncbi:MAG TPA: hypothetical protein VFK94_05950, partial [Patescibacteria group bacterium]|nr:hypothetical protein [Patescibacteria group bacterium]
SGSVPGEPYCVLRKVLRQTSCLTGLGGHGSWEPEWLMGRPLSPLRGLGFCLGDRFPRAYARG